MPILRAYTDGKMKILDIAFILDLDGYWIEIAACRSHTQRTLSEGMEGKDILTDGMYCRGNHSYRLPILSSIVLMLVLLGLS